MRTFRNHSIVNADFVGNSIQVVGRTMLRSLAAISVCLLGTKALRACRPYCGLCCATSQRWEKSNRLSDQRTAGTSLARGSFGWAR